MMEPLPPPRVWPKGGENENLHESRSSDLALLAAIPANIATARQHSKRPGINGLFSMARLIAVLALGTAAVLAVRAIRRVYRRVPDDFEPIGLLPAPEKEPAVD
jgi:hypothetical protein